jgi:hypothetical protein
MAKPGRFHATVRERILIHLLDYTKKRLSPDVPHETTQAGITEVVSGSRSHVSMVLASLVDTELVEEKLTHVKGDVRRKKTYFLTAKGLREGTDIRERFLRTPIRVFVEGKTEEVEIGELDEILDQTYFLVDILVSVDEQGVLDMESLTGQKVSAVTAYTTPLVQVLCGRCQFSFLVQPEADVWDSYTICPRCSDTIQLAEHLVQYERPKEMKEATAGPVFVASGVLIAMAVLQVTALALFCAVFLLGISRMAILAFGTSLGVYISVTLKIFLTKTLDLEIYAYSFLILLAFFSLVLLPRLTPKKFRLEFAMSGGVTLSVVGGAIAFLPGTLPPSQFHAPLWLILGFSAFIFGFENARPVENMRPLLFAGVGAAILVLVGAMVWQSHQSFTATETLVAALWTVLGVLLISTRLFPRAREHDVEEALVFALPLAVGVLLAMFGTLVIMRQLYAEGGFELVVGIPLVIWSMGQVSRSHWKTWLIVYAYVVVAVVISFWTLFYSVL